MKGEKEREFFRIHIPGLIVKYNILPKTEGRYFLPRRHHHSKPLLPEDSELQSELEILFERLDRLETKIDYLLHWLGRGTGEKIFQFESEVTNIGGGGISFISPVPLEVNTFLELCILSIVGDMPPILAIGKVCWQKMSSDRSKEASYSIGVCFEDIYAEDQQTLMRMIFQAEIQQRKRREGEKS
ncbi:PilZ domain-containing protein [Thermodesulforhabdus norvegica]|uniref:PilZ domain-containing protein n=1 Tax=Thermodesulforhabdus norvegica TaxID=39841 RepID=A0A1I4QS27_9BACT|nr:PilZ domain-containing protein [Thermodesulforhabdus norvegica]SFM42849.1 PilZ domain-containing protein [Thermodesulforhabdus norvegica]